MRVADDEVAVAREAETARPAVAEVRRAERDAEVIAVEVERLDAGGEIDDPQPVVAVDDRGPRADELAVLHAASAPHLVGAVAAGAAGEEQEDERDAEHT